MEHLIVIFVTINNSISGNNININIDDGLLELGPNLSSVGSIKFDKTNH